MSGWSPLVLIELVLVFGSVMGWGFWQLWTLRRDRLRQEAQAAAQASPTRASAPGSATDRT